MIKNPFTVKSPESLDPQTIADLFVDVFTDFPKVQENGHTFIHGARGTGKSMMLRFLEPAVQLAAKKVDNIFSLQHFSVHVPLPAAQLNIVELSRLEKSAQYAFGEHLLVIHIAGRIADALSRNFSYINNDKEVQEFTQNVLSVLRSCGWKSGVEDVDENINFDNLFSVFANEFRRTFSYLNRLSLPLGALPPYEGALATYLDLILPLVDYMKELTFFPNAPVYLMLDDADNLTEPLQRVVNTWVSLRTQKKISLKISTQNRYKTYRTQDDRLVMAPHDYDEVNIDTIYTSRKDHYYNRVLEIVRRRLKNAYGSDIDPHSYFPVKKEQEEAIEKIAHELRSKWDEGKGRGYRASDDAIRYARPEYIRKLSGSSKSGSTYSYAGFKSMVDLSSGVVRWFLEPASSMHSETVSRKASGTEIGQIPISIQDQVIKEWSESFILAEFEKLKISNESEKTEPTKETTNEDRFDHVQGLYNLINSLGSAFHKKLIDKTASERKIFSIMVSGQLSKETEEIFSLGIEWGYFQKSTMGSKEGSGRRVQYILSRRLAPYFKLDPSGYAAYLSVTPEDLKLACVHPEGFVRKRLGDREGQNHQESLF